MVVKMIRWLPWPPLHSKKMRVRLDLHCVEGLNAVEGCMVGVVLKWKGPKGGLGSRFRRSVKRNCSAFQSVNGGVVEFNEDFENVCVIAMGKEGGGFQPWEVCLEIVHNSIQEQKTKPSILGTSLLNLAEFASCVEDAKQNTKIVFSFCIGEVTLEASFSISIEFVELQTSQEALEPVHRLVVPALSFTGGNLLSEKEEFSAFKAGLRKVKTLKEFVVVGRSKKVSEEEDGSDDKLSPRSEEHESADMFDSDSANELEQEIAEGQVGLKIRKSFSYGNLATANLVVEGVIYLDPREDLDGDKWVMNSLPSFELLPKLVDEPSSSDSDHTVPQTSMRSLLTWKKRKVTFRSARERGEPLLNKAYGDEGGDDIDFDRRQAIFPIQSLSLLNDKDDIESASNISPNIAGCSGFGADNFTIGSWEQKELFSRDSEMNLSTKLFFASIDQRSERAAGESACTALVAVIADWLQKNPTLLPIKSQFDTLIQEGSLEWRKLWEVESYKERFSDGHFDLETILQAKVRPLSIISEKNFVGFFKPEGLEDTFKFLQEVMSFDHIWEEITSGNTDDSQTSKSDIYIVSWNDHFFVLKVEKEAYYIIDTLGERLFEGCNQAYILKFDKDSEMYQLPLEEKKSEEKAVTLEHSKLMTSERGIQLEQKNAVCHVMDTRTSEVLKNRDNEKKLICRGKECCKEFIKGFLAAIPLRELHVDIKKGLEEKTLLRRLQIDFHCTAKHPAS